MHVHALVCVGRGLRGFSEAGWMCLCGEGWSQEKEGQTVQPQDKLPPKKVGHCTVHAHLGFVMEQQSKEGWGPPRTCVSRGVAASLGWVGAHATSLSQGISSVSGGVFMRVS